MLRLGKIQDVINGNVDQKLASKIYNASDFAYGFELGTPKDINSLGEAVLVNEYCYATSSDEESIENGKLICGNSFRAGGMFFIPHGATPTHQAIIEKEGGPVDCNHFYETMDAKIGEPFAFAGIVHFDSIHGFAISKPPIYGEKIFENRSKYLRNPEIFDNDLYAFIVGIVANFNKLKDHTLQRELQTVLYRNPLDKEAPLLYHTHALTLKYQVASINEIKPNAAEKCLHLLSDGSSIASGTIDIYSIKELKELHM